MPSSSSLRRLPAGQVADLGVGERRPSDGGGLVGLVDDADAVAVDLHGAVEEVGDAERDDHGDLLMPLVTASHPSYPGLGGRCGTGPNRDERPLMALSPLAHVGG